MVEPMNELSSLKYLNVGDFFGVFRLDFFELFRISFAQQKYSQIHSSANKTTSSAGLDSPENEFNACDGNHLFRLNFTDRFHYATQQLVSRPRSVHRWKYSL